MNKYLEAAVKRYSKKKSLIHPISNEDAEIISLFIEILGEVKDLKLNRVLSSYKFKSDKDVLLALRKWKEKKGEEKKNIEDEKVNGVKIYNPMLLIGKYRIPLYSILRFEPEDKLIRGDEEPDKMKYFIVLNKHFEDISGIVYSNIYVEFINEELRDEALEWLDSYIDQERGVIKNEE